VGCKLKNLIFAIFVSLFFVGCKPKVNDDAQALAVHSGAKTEWRNRNGVYGQEYFHYDPSKRSYPLKQRPDPKERLFLSVPYYQRWVYGKDYQYDDQTNEITFLKNPPAVYADGGLRDNQATLAKEMIVWIFYWPDGELDANRRKFGNGSQDA
jgi:hypothetical protein